MKENLTTAKPVLALLVKWTVGVILFVTVVIIILYCVGSYSHAADSAQLGMVKSLLFVGVLLGVSSFYGLILDLWYALRRKNPAYVAGIIGYALLLIFGTLSAMGAAFILSAVEGTI
jgi:hypothetical protein